MEKVKREKDEKRGWKLVRGEELEEKKRRIEKEDDKQDKG